MPIRVPKRSYNGHIRCQISTIIPVIWGIVQKYNSNVNVSIVVDDASVENAWMNDVISSPLDILFLNYSIDTFSSHTCVCRLLRVLSRRKKKLKIFSFNLVLTEFTQTRDKYLFHLELFLAYIIFTCRLFTPWVFFIWAEPKTDRGAKRGRQQNNLCICPQCIFVPTCPSS